MKTNIVTEAYASVENAAKTVASQEVRVVNEIAVNKHVRQGDLYLTRIDKLDSNYKNSFDYQLAPGSTMGSRHVAAGDGVKIFRSSETNNRVGNKILGPQISAPKGLVIEHPEHAHIQLPAGNYQVSYQLDWAQQQAVRD